MAHPAMRAGRRGTLSKYAIGVDFGSESGRAVVVDVADGTSARHRGLA